MNARHIKTRIHKTLQRFGFDIVPYSGRYFPSRRRIETINTTRVGTVIDVGANQGQFVDELRRDGWQGPILSVEPLPAAYGVLAERASSDQLWTTINVAAGAASGVASFNVAENQVSSSFFAVNERHQAAAPASQSVETRDVAVETLDYLVAERNLGGPFYLKIDTQGYELEVLRGAPSSIEASTAIELELSLEELYEGQPLMPEMVVWLLDHGFIPVAVWPSFFGPRGIPLQMDGIFVKT